MSLHSELKEVKLKGQLVQDVLVNHLSGVRLKYSAYMAMSLRAKRALENHNELMELLTTKMREADEADSFIAHMGLVDEFIEYVETTYDKGRDKVEEDS